MTSLTHITRGAGSIRVTIGASLGDQGAKLAICDWLDVGDRFNVGSGQPRSLRARHQGMVHADLTRRRADSYGAPMTMVADGAVDDVQHALSPPAPYRGR